jgi:dTDP-4-dehydrorhamnose reductase
MFAYFFKKRKNRNMKKIILFGAQGLLGLDCFCVFSKQSEYSVLPISRFNYDLMDPEETERAFSDHTPDIVLNCAGFSDVDSAELPENEDIVYGLNTGVPAHLARLCKKTNALLVHFSTDYVFPGTKGGYSETSKIEPVNVYGDSKAEGEMAIWEQTEEAFIIRTSRLFGFARDNLVKKIMAKAKKGVPISAIGDERGNFTYTKDLAQATLALLETHKNDYGVFHLCGKDVHSPYEAVQIIVQKTGSKSSVQKVSAASLERTAQRPKDSSLVSVRTKISLPGFKDAFERFLNE